MPIDEKDFERTLAKAGVEPTGFDVRYGDKRVHYTAANKDKINFNAATRITIEFPKGSLGYKYIDGEYADKNRSKVRPSKKDISNGKNSR